MGGWKVIRNLSKSPRFHTYLVKEKSGRVAFLKTTTPETKLSRELETEVWWNLTLERIVAQLPKDKKIFRPPKIYAFAREKGTSWYLSEYFDAPLLAQPKEEEKIKKEIENIVAVLITLDQVRVEHLPGTSLYSEEGESAPYNHLLKKVDKWMVKPLGKGQITKEKVTKGKKLIEKYRKFVYPALQHGDFVPWHMFRLDKKTIGIVDGEHASLIKPRFYDLSYLYTRLYTKAHVPILARKALKIFLEKSKLEKASFFKAFLPVLTLRIFGIQNDAVIDNDYQEQAKKLFELCLKEDLTVLL